ncbi:MAG: amino acid--tRNA ligase-related protein [Polyangiaceae bacterium]
MYPEHMDMLYGRILDSWQTDDATSIELAVGDTRRQLCLATGVATPAARGDIVKAKLGPDGAVTALERLSGPSPGTWDATGDALRWRRLGSMPSRMALLQRRDLIVRALRAYLHEEGFWEIQAPLLVRGTCPEPHIHSFGVDDHYLSTSTEYQLKRLLVGGFEKIFSLTQNFRHGDSGLIHNPEFTMLEWTRAFGSIDAIERDAEELVRRAVDAIFPGADTLRFGKHVVRVAGVPWQRLSVRDALREHLHIDVAPDFSLESLQAECLRTNQLVPAEFLSDPHTLVSILVDKVSPLLGTSVPVFLRGWPAFMTSSAGGAQQGEIAERSELFIAGVEVSDGFPALTDPIAQRASFATTLAQRRQDGLPVVDVDERYVAALEQGMPPAAGMALGVDRLVMVVLGESQIQRVVPFAWDEL